VCVACKSYLFYAALYFHLWPVWLYDVFLHYLINGTIFGGKGLLNGKCDFEFIYNSTYEELIEIVSKTQTERILLHLKAQSVPRCKHFISVIKTILFM
jgi:hypothetical protein